LFFDLAAEDDQPIQSRQLLTEYGGISELCWITDDIIAVGTTRGKIITFSSRNRAVSAAFSKSFYVRMYALIMMFSGAILACPRH
jgi:hypothetical protein